MYLRLTAFQQIIMKLPVWSKNFGTKPERSLKTGRVKKCVKDELRDISVSGYVLLDV